MAAVVEPAGALDAPVAHDGGVPGAGRARLGRAAAPARGGGNPVAQGGQPVTNIQVPKIFTTAFGAPDYVYVYVVVVVVLQVVVELVKVII